MGKIVFFCDINAATLKIIGNSTPVINKENENGVGIGTANMGNNSTACTLNISKEAMLRYQNSTSNAEINNDVREKRKLLTTDDVYISQKSSCHGKKDPFAGWQMLDVMKADDPEAYAEYTDFFEKGANEFVEKIEENGLTRYEITGEGVEHFTKAEDIFEDWFCRRCIKNGEIYNPLTGQSGGVMKKLNEVHPDMEFEVYSNKYSNGYSEGTSVLHRYEFNILLSVDMVKRLASVESLDELSDEDKELMNRIDKAADDMRSIADEYKEKYSKLRLGVKLSDDGSILYHAKYNGCENPDGITAGSKEELLEMMKRKGD